MAVRTSTAVECFCSTGCPREASNLTSSGSITYTSASPPYQRKYCVTAVPAVFGTCTKMNLWVLFRIVIGAGWEQRSVPCQRLEETSTDGVDNRCVPAISTFVDPLRQDGSSTNPCPSIPNGETP